MSAVRCSFSASMISLLVVAVTSQPTTAAEPKPPAIELFAGMEAGELEVKIIPKDATKGTIIVENKTGKPVTIKLPDAFGAVPVLAQFGACPGGGGGCPGGGGNQGMGGGMMG